MKPREDRSALSGRSSFHFFERSTRPRSGTRTRARRGGDAEPPARSRPPARGFAVLVAGTPFGCRFGGDGRACNVQPYNQRRGGTGRVAQLRRSKP